MKKRLLFKIISFLFIIGISVYFLYKCPFDFLFGISCPGCGMTRSLIRLLHFDFSGAFYYHPLFPLGVLLSIFFFLDYFNIYKMNYKPKNIILTIIGIIFIITYIIRIITKSPVLEFDFTKSIIYKLFSAIFN